MDWRDLEGALGKMAPMLGTIIGGPAGAAVGSLVASALGCSNDPASVATALGNPEAAAKLAQIEADKQVQLQRLVIEHANVVLQSETADIQAAAADRDSARKREETVKDYTPAILAWLVILLAASAEGSVLMGVAHPASEAVAQRILGTLDAALMLVLAYYFGSSSGQSRQTELLAKAGPVQ